MLICKYLQFNCKINYFYTIFLDVKMILTTFML